MGEFDIIAWVMRIGWCLWIARSFIRFALKKEGRFNSSLIILGWLAFFAGLALYEYLKLKMGYAWGALLMAISVPFAEYAVFQDAERKSNSKR